MLSGLKTFTWQLAGTGIGVLTIGLAGGWWISRRILRPIARIAATASRISATNLSERIDLEHVESELAELADILNGTFERLESAFERQTQFTADASHELRTPLAVIRSQAELALSRPRDAAEYQEALGACLAATARMTNLVEGLLTLARCDAQIPGECQERIQWNRVVADAVDLCQPLAEERKIRVRTDLATCYVLGDPVALSRAVANLVANAIQYNQHDGKVHVAVTVEQSEALLNGAGYRTGHSTGASLASLRAILPGRQGAIACHGRDGIGPRDRQNRGGNAWRIHWFLFRTRPGLDILDALAAGRVEQATGRRRGDFGSDWLVAIRFVNWHSQFFHRRVAIVVHAAQLFSRQFKSSAHRIGHVDRL